GDHRVAARRPRGPLEPRRQPGRPAPNGRPSAGDGGPEDAARAPRAALREGEPDDRHVGPIRFRDRRRAVRGDWRFTTADWRLTNRQSVNPLIINCQSPIRYSPIGNPQSTISPLSARPADRRAWHGAPANSTRAA